MVSGQEHSDDAEILFQDALTSANAGKFDEAHAALSRCLDLAGGDPRVHVLSGVVWLARGQPNEAVDAYSRAIELGFEDENIRNDLGVALQGLGRHEEAIEAFRSLLGIRPDFAPAHINLAQSLIAQARLRDALEHVVIAVEISPGSSDYLRSLGVILNELGRHDDAIEHLTKAVEIDPAYVIGWESLAVGLSHAGRHEESLAAHRKALDVQPDWLDGYRNLALAHIAMKQFDEAISVANQAIRLAPDAIEPQIWLAHMLGESYQLEAALEQIDRALEFDPAHLEALEMKSNMLRTAKRYGELLPVLLDVLKVKPHSTKTVGDAVDAVLTLCAWEQAKPFIATLVEQIENNIEQGLQIGVCVNNLQSLPVPYEFIAEAAAATSKLRFEEAAAVRAACDFDFPAPAVSRASERIRIGYLVPYVHAHSLPVILREIVERHDRNKFDVFGYCPGVPDDSEFSRGYVDAFDAMAFGSGSDRAIAEKIRADGIDILIDVAGLTLVDCMNVNALRPAPIIAHFLGYSITTGADYIDYLITDEIYVSEEDAKLGPEAMVYLPECFLATKRFEIADDRPTRAEEGLPPEGRVFCNFNQPFKFEPEIFSVWMRILEQVPDSVLWLGDWSPQTRLNLYDEAKGFGIDEQRLVFSKILPYPRHLARLGLADLALDSFHHGGGVTTVDCLWAGVPVLSCAGTTPSARLGKSILHAANLSDLVVEDLRAYESRAVAYGKDPQGLAELRNRWAANRLTCPLFDNERYMGHLESAYEMMWQNYRSGNAPQDLRVPKRVAI